MLRQLNCKPGPLAPETAAQVAALSPEALLDLSDALLDFTGLTDLQAWLAQQSSA